MKVHYASQNFLGKRLTAKQSKRASRISIRAEAEDPRSTGSIRKLNRVLEEIEVDLMKKR